MLDKISIDFLKYLISVDSVRKFEFYNYFAKHKISYKLAKNYYFYLIKEGFIKTNKNHITYPTFKTKLYLNYLNKSKIKNFFVIYILPYIQQFIIFLLGLLAPYLLKLIKQIL